MFNTPNELASLAKIAQAPARDFQHWRAGVALERPTLLTGVAQTVLSYKVPPSYSLVVTGCQQWTSAPLTGTTPGTPPAVQPLIAWGSLYGWFAIDDQEITDKFAPLFSVSEGGLILTFPPGQCARFYILNGGPDITQEFALAFNFSGFLTLPEHAERLEPMRTIVPNASQLACP